MARRQPNHPILSRPRKRTFPFADAADEKVQQVVLAARAPRFQQKPIAEERGQHVGQQTAHQVRHAAVQRVRPQRTLHPLPPSHTRPMSQHAKPSRIVCRLPPRGAQRDHFRSERTLSAVGVSKCSRVTCTTFFSLTRSSTVDVFSSVRSSSNLAAVPDTHICHEPVSFTREETRTTKSRRKGRGWRTGAYEWQAWLRS